MAAQFIIYGLVDPRDGQLRYVGKSCCGKRRARQHAMPSHLARDHAYKGCWIRSLGGRKPFIVVLQEFQEADILSDAERHWIRYFRALGCPLTNLTDGGDGVSGHRKTQETLQKMRQSAFRRWGRSEPLRDSDVITRYLRGGTLREIAAEFQTSSSMVYQVLKRNGTPVRDRHQPRRKRSAA